MRFGLARGLVAVVFFMLATAMVGPPLASARPTATSAASAATDPPTATIFSPADGSFYRLNQAVTASYTCADSSGGPGIASCSGTRAEGAAVDTSALGQYTFSVTATSRDGQSTTIQAKYTVAGPPPPPTVSSPKQGAVYTLGQAVPASFGCAEGPFGPGLVDCLSPLSVDTSVIGANMFTVDAISNDGQIGMTSVHYTVITPSNKFTVSRLVAHRTGVVTLRLAAPGAGTVIALETAPRSALPKAKRGRLVFAKRGFAATGKQTLKLTIKPNAAGRALERHHRGTVRITLALTFEPINGNARTRTFHGLVVTP